MNDTMHPSRMRLGGLLALRTTKLAVAALATVAITQSTQAALAATHAGPTTAVEMGDSYMAGLGDRWLGNSLEVQGNRGGTDRACSPSIDDCQTYEESKVYEDECRRSDLAQIKTAKLPYIHARVNLACGSAEAKNVRLSSDGGEGQNGEPPQADQLLEVARSHNVKFIVLGIGGNDISFGQVLLNCATAYMTHTTPCSQTQEEALSETTLAPFRKNIAEAINDIKSAMSQDGYIANEYKLALEDLPALSAPSQEVRYPELGVERTVYGCPMYNVDFDWLQSTAYPKFTAFLKGIAHEDGLPMLEMQHAFAGHELCSKHDSEASAANPPTALTMEWGRPFNTQAIAEGLEIWHPDAYGAMAQGSCLGGFYKRLISLTAVPGDYACLGASARPPEKERLSWTGST